MSGVGSALAGLDAALPDSDGMWAGNLTLAINNGSVPESQLDNIVTRIVSTWYQMEQDKEDFHSPGYGLTANISEPHAVVDARGPSAKPTLFDGAAEGHVLVKNDNGALPLKSSDMKLISIFGYSAKAPNVNNRRTVESGYMFSVWGMGVEPANLTEASYSFIGNLSIPKSSIAVNGTMVSGGGSGATAQNLVSAPFDALVQQAYEDDTALFWDFESGSPLVDPTSNACLDIGNVWATEGYDRLSVRDDFTDNLIINVANQCGNTIVVFHNAGTRLVDNFVDHPNVTAITFAHLPGQDSGSSLVSLLYGKTNPSGRLPYTVARDESDYGALLEPDVTPPPNRYNITPRYEFGFGWSYTRFAYADPRVSETTAASQAYPHGGRGPRAAKADLWDVVAAVTARVANTGGGVDGKEVVQLYVGIPGDGSPVRQLRGFEKPAIAAGETVSVTFEPTRRDLGVWDVVAQNWLLQQGQSNIYVGSSSRTLPLSGTLDMESGKTTTRCVQKH